MFVVPEMTSPLLGAVGTVAIGETNLYANLLPLPRVGAVIVIAIEDAPPTR
jgi:hypothetical protein